MNESIEAIERVVEWYKTAKNVDPHKLVEALRTVTSHLVTLETHRSHFKLLYEQKVFTLRQEGESVSGAQNKASIDVHELYLLRRFMDASYEMVGAMRSQLSFIKLEYNDK